MQTMYDGESTIELGASEFSRSLEVLYPQIGQYGWMWRILNLRARAHGYFPHRLFTVLRYFVHARKPYFIGHTGDGIAWLGDARDRYSAECAMDPNYDRVLCRFLLAHAPDPALAYLDVGANMGITAATMAKSLSSAATVCAFEPLPETARRAAATFALNRLRNVRLFQMAIGDKNEEIPFFAGAGYSEAASATPTAEGGIKRWSESRVQCRTLDSLMDTGTLGRVGLIKLDVEGYEPQALRGGTRLLARDKPGLLYEYHPWIAPSLGWTPSDIAQLVRSIGRYQFEVFHYDGSTTAFPPPSDALEVVNIYGACQPPRATNLG